MNILITLKFFYTHVQHKFMYVQRNEYHDVCVFVLAYGRINFNTAHSSLREK